MIITILLFSVMRCYWLTLRSAWCEDTRVWQYPNFFFRNRYLFLVPNFSGTGSDNYFRGQIFPVPVTVLIFSTNIFRYRFRHLFLVPNFSGTKIFRYHPKKWKILWYWYQIPSSTQFLSAPKILPKFYLYSTLSTTRRKSQWKALTIWCSFFEAWITQMVNDNLKHATNLKLVLMQNKFLLVSEKNLTDGKRRRRRIGNSSSVFLPR